MILSDQLFKRADPGCTYDIHYDDLVALFVGSYRFIHRDFTGFFLFLAQIHQKFIFDAFGCVTGELAAFFRLVAVDRLIRPIVPIDRRSSGSRTDELYFLTMWATSLRLYSIRVRRASSSPDMHRFIYSFSLSGVRGFLNASICFTLPAALPAAIKVICNILCRLCKNSAYPQIQIWIFIKNYKKTGKICTKCLKCENTVI